MATPETRFHLPTPPKEKGSTMGTCFVIQPFDAGRFDKLYEDVLIPAIKAAGLEPYRVDRDPRVSVPIDDIEKEIRVADVCLAEISTDNPNVWFELGFAISAKKSVILVCSKERDSKFPFDVQHRHILKYTTESPRDFDDLKAKLTARLKAALEREEELERVVDLPPIASVEGLKQHEMVALIAIAQNLDQPADSVSVYQIRQDMEKAGFTRVATTLALVTLLRKGMVTNLEEFDHDDRSSFTAYSLSNEGMTWLLSNQDRLELKREPMRHQAYAPPPDEIPF